MVFIMGEGDTSTRRKFASLLGALSLPILAGCTTDEDGSDNTNDNEGEEADTTNDSESTTTEDTSEEVIFERVSDERASTTFSAKRGDEIVVNVDNREGFRTHIVIRSTDFADGIGTLLSEGVEDDDTFRVLIEEDATYTIEMTPHDETESTFGKVKAVLIPGESSEQAATEEGEEPELGEDPEEAAQNWVTNNQQDIETALEEFEQGTTHYNNAKYQQAKDAFDSAELQFFRLRDEVHEIAFRGEDNPLFETFDLLRGCFSGMTAAAQIRKEAAASIVEQGDEQAAAESWEESEEILQTLEDYRQRAEEEIGVDPLDP